MSHARARSATGTPGTLYNRRTRTDKNMAASIDPDSLADELLALHETEGLVAPFSERHPGLTPQAGYREAARRPMVKENWANEGRNWVLLTKPV